MQTTDDRALLRQYAETGSEDAFSELLRRHVNLVYSAALRRVGNPAQAEEITQAVFVVLARKAPSLSPKVVVPGWLYRATSLAAANWIRSEARRMRREKESSMQPPANEIENDAWTQIAPMLDDAMDRLNGSDREAIVMRFFEGKSMEEVGTICGISENAAKKRVYRGLERLRKFFSRRGVVLSAAVIAGLMASKSVQAAPVGLIGKVALVAAKGGAASGLVAGTLKLMLWEKLKLALVYGGAGLVVVGAAVSIASSVLASGGGAKMPGMHLEGTMVEYQMDQKGDITATNFGGFLNGVRFELWRKGSRWAVRLSSANTNLSGSVSIVTCDGTDIYSFVPGVNGSWGLPKNVVKFQNVGSIYPGAIKTFNAFMAPLWWGYCSSLAGAGDGPLPDFVAFWSINPTHPEMPGATALLHVLGTNDFRLGPVQMALSQKDSRTGKFTADPYCDIVPLEVTNVDGVMVVTKCQMNRYWWPTEYIDSKPAVLERFEIAVDKAERDDAFTAFVPELVGMTEITDYRSTQRFDSYLSDHWVDPGEKIRHSAIPVVLGPLGKDVNVKTPPASVAKQPHLVRKKAPVFRARTIDGRAVQFPGDYKGKIVLLDFWATWCGPCLAELPNVSAAYEKFHSRGVEFLGVSLDKSEEIAQLGAFCQAHKMAWPEICDGKEWKADLAKLYSVELIPSSFLVDGDTGVVLQEGEALRGERLEPAIEQALKKK